MVLGLAPRSRRPSVENVSQLALHALGLVIGGASVGAIAGGVGSALLELVHPRIVAGLVGLLLGAYALVELGVLRLPVLGRHWQVPRFWQTHATPRAAYFAYGLLLGVGFLTIAPYAALTSVFVLQVASASVLPGAAVGATYGLGRAASFAIGVGALGQSASNYTFVQRVADRMPLWRRTLAILGIVGTIIYTARAIT